MAAITDYEVFTSMIDQEDLTDVHSVFISVQQVSDYGGFNTQANGNNWYVTADAFDDMLVLTPKSRPAFLRYLDSKFEIEKGQGLIASYDIQEAYKKD